MRFPLLLLLAPLLLAAHAAALSAAKQFSLDPDTTASTPFLQCHGGITKAVNLPGRDTNFPEAITLNCKFKTWNTLMASCLLRACVSAPDLAYASFCRRAGVPGVEFTFPQWFLESDGGAYYLASLESSAAGRPGVAAAAALAGVVVAAFIQ
ncbi:uncharacterized protein LOC62_02G002271 [Vanrija pseudolonga]|uniref:Uncharacterized protein n=1 Tax=Vanrija pseudolonga TaxID=143232 RepID=A0AAF1BGG7_9TREE|nr:hypothetical protein LOC62_02G002271 [Vanrija pseudolonga]